jgi:hypothetical protein
VKKTAFTGDKPIRETFWKPALKKQVFDIASHTKQDILMHQ